MNPKDFIETAAHLKDQDGEHYVRTSISRSYYAVHLHICQFISKAFLGGKKFKHNRHKNILHCLNRCDAKDIKEIGAMLSDLLQGRIDADYKMDKIITPQKCEDIYDDACELLLDFESKIIINTNKQKLAKSSIQQAKNERILW